MSFLTVLNESLFRYGGIYRKNEPPLIKEHVYAFNSIHKTKYIVRVEEYKYDLFIIKFHLKKHSRNIDKYVVLTDENNCPKGIMSSVLAIVLQVLNQNNKASFGFIGSPTKLELNHENYLKNTKRFRVYTKYAITFFDPENFYHHCDVNHSSYLLINKQKNNEVSDLLNKILLEFDTYFDITQLFSDLRKEILNAQKA